MTRAHAEVMWPDEVTWSDDCLKVPLDYTHVSPFSFFTAYCLIKVKNFILYEKIAHHPKHTHTYI